jgi:hypothetical protein
MTRTEAQAIYARLWKNDLTKLSDQDIETLHEATLCLSHGHGHSCGCWDCCIDSEVSIEHYKRRQKMMHPDSLSTKLREEFVAITDGEIAELLDSQEVVEDETVIGTVSRNTQALFTLCHKKYVLARTLLTILNDPARIPMDDDAVKRAAAISMCDEVKTLESMYGQQVQEELSIRHTKFAIRKGGQIVTC